MDHYSSGNSRVNNHVSVDKHTYTTINRSQHIIGDKVNIGFIRKVLTRNILRLSSQIFN